MVYDWLIVWTLRHNKFQGLIMFALHAYLLQLGWNVLIQLILYSQTLKRF